MSDQIQNISEEILEYKNKIFFKILSDYLKEKKAPFPENTKHYLNLLFNNITTEPSGINLSSIRKENNSYIVSLTGTFDSYIEINGVPTNFDSEGKIADFSVPALIKADDILNFYISVVNFPYKKEKPASYTNDKTAQNIIDTVEFSNFLMVNEKIEEPAIGVLKYINNVVAEYSVTATWLDKTNAENSTGKGFVKLTNTSNVPVKIVFNGQEHIVLDGNHVDVPFDLDEFLETHKNSGYNQAVAKNSEGTEVLTVDVTNLLTQEELNNVRLTVNTAIDRTNDQEFPARIKPILANTKFFGEAGYYVNFMGSVIKVPSQTEANGGIPVSKAEILAMDENNKKIFICDKDGNMIGKSITPTIFVTNNVKLIKASIK
jgi:hypothetical protein|nr:MAG TPA: hypothetical protein [Caudoviricetes sp.]